MNIYWYNVSKDLYNTIYRYIGFDNKILYPKLETGKKRR